EFSNARESLHKEFGKIEDAVIEAIRTVHAHPEFHRANISTSCEGACRTWFDRKKIERALVNLLRNACEFMPAGSGKVEVSLRENNGQIEMRITDNGPGVPEPIREKLFQPFVSYGKQNGIGLGLAIVQKIFEDHGGRVCLERSEPGRTVFTSTLPILAMIDDPIRTPLVDGCSTSSACL